MISYDRLRQQIKFIIDCYQGSITKENEPYIRSTICGLNLALSIMESEKEHGPNAEEN